LGGKGDDDAIGIASEGEASTGQISESSGRCRFLPWDGRYRITGKIPAVLHGSEGRRGCHHRNSESKNRQRFTQVHVLQALLCDKAGFLRNPKGLYRKGPSETSSTPFKPSHQAGALAGLVMTDLFQPLPFGGLCRLTDLPFSMRNATDFVSCSKVYGFGRNRNGSINKAFIPAFTPAPVV
jgi:hypothetical protein